MMTLDLEIADEKSDTGGTTWDRFCGVSVKIRCPHDLGVGICAQLCVYVFEIVWIVVINLGEVDCVCSCVMDFMVFFSVFLR